jgi:uncharacterized damage-inducible protein DinB
VADLLKVAFQHNAWATKELITFCRRLTLAQLSSATQGTCHSRLPGHPQPRSLLDTLDHQVLSDADYLPRPRMERPVWALEQRHASDLDELEARADETAQLWQVYLDDPLEATDLLLLDQGTYEVQSSTGGRSAPSSPGWASNRRTCRSGPTARPPDAGVS